MSVWNDTKEYRCFLTTRDKQCLRELRGFLIGLEAAGKTVPGLHNFKQLEEKLEKLVKDD